MNEETKSILSELKSVNDEAKIYMNLISDNLKDIQLYLRNLSLTSDFEFYLNNEETRSLIWNNETKKIYYLSPEVDGSIPILDLPFEFRQMIYDKYIQKFLEKFLAFEKEELAMFKKGETKCQN